jgi:hypothetical protein
MRSAVSTSSVWKAWWKRRSRCNLGKLFRLDAKVGFAKPPLFGLPQYLTGLSRLPHQKIEVCPREFGTAMYKGCLTRGDPNGRL